MIKVKGFSYDTEKHKHIIDHINKQPVGSKYIWDLVEKDMNKKDLETIIEEKIHKCLENIEITKKKETPNIDVSSIKGILDM